MGKIPEKYAASLRFWILVIVAVYFAYGVYYAASGIRDSIGMLSTSTFTIRCHRTHGGGWFSSTAAKA